MAADAYSLLTDAIAAAEARGVDSDLLDDWRPLVDIYRARRDWKAAAQLAITIDNTAGRDGQTRVGQVDGSLGAFLTSGEVFSDPGARLEEAYQTAKEGVASGTAALVDDIRSAATLPPWLVASAAVIVASVALFSVGYVVRALK
jgi:hypothetical protein